VVRVTASQARKKPEQHFSSQGVTEPWILEISKRGCTPVFQERDVAMEPASYRYRRITLRKRAHGCFWFRSIEGAGRTIADYEDMNVIRKGQMPVAGKRRCSGSGTLHRTDLRGCSVIEFTLLRKWPARTNPFTNPFATDPPFERDLPENSNLPVR
jgi:hypothetical protein